MNNKVLICHDPNIPVHSADWTKGWIEYCESNGIKYDLINIMKENAIEKLKEYDAILWHFGNYNYEEMLEARSILNSANLMGLKVFPNINEQWHFDDKVAEMYALQAVNAPIPNSQVHYFLGSLQRALKDGDIKFPIVAKLRTGSGSHNVKLIHTKDELLKYASIMFGKGYNPSPSVLYKTSSNIRSTRNWKTFVSKFKRIPEFIRTMSGAKKFPNEKGYVYLQDFLPNDNFDMKVMVLGDKCTGFYRPVRSHDFRASGGGAFVDDPKAVFTEQIVKSAFAAADALGMRCVGFDYVIDNRTGEGKIIEMSYGCGHEVDGAGGYFDRDFNWIPEPITIAGEIMKMLGY